MSHTTFTTNPVSLEQILRHCEEGKIQLPDFQRSWVWDEVRIKGLIASVSKAFPIGALMALKSKDSGKGDFAYRPVEGASAAAANSSPEQLLLDGQQRMTSLFQACMRKQVMKTITPKNKVVKRWFYLDMKKALESGADREDAILGVPEDRKIKTNFDKDVLMDLSTPELEYENLMFPLHCAFKWDDWRDGFEDHWFAKNDQDMRLFFRKFKDEVLQNFTNYQVPVIALGKETSHEAVCLVFEKVNTGGKALDAFELLTAMYAAQGHKLRNDWLGDGINPGIQQVLMTFGRAADQKTGVLEKVASTDLLQSISLLYTAKVRAEREAEGKKDKELPAVRATRQSLLDLPLEAYLEFRDPVVEGYKMAGKFLRQRGIYRIIDLPYQTQLVPLAAIFAKLGNKGEHAGHQAKIERWFWCGIFGELYGSTIENRFAKDIQEVPAWLAGGPEPSTVREGVFRTERLQTMRTRLSAAYKGIHALLMAKGAKDFRTGQSFDTTVFFDESVDIHHIFPRGWCEGQKISEKIFDTVINKTPLSAKTNRILGGVAPTKYLAKLEKGKPAKGGGFEDPPIDLEDLDEFLKTHGIEPSLLRSDDFEGFMEARKQFLLNLISEATGHPIAAEVEAADEGEDIPEDMARDLDLQFEIA